jgi:hypothetical protein
LSLRSNPGLTLADAFSVKTKSKCLEKFSSYRPPLARARAAAEAIEKAFKQANARRMGRPNAAKEIVEQLEPQKGTKDAKKAV